MRIAGRAHAATPGAMIRAGVARIPEDRHREGVVPGLSLAENLALETLGAPGVQRWGFLRRRSIRAAATRAIAAYEQCGHFAEAQALAYRVACVRLWNAGTLGLAWWERVELFAYWAAAGFGHRPARVLLTAAVVLPVVNLEKAWRKRRLRRRTARLEASTGAAEG